MKNKHILKKHNIIGILRRTAALALVAAFLMPSQKVYALDYAMQAYQIGSQLLGGEEEEETSPEEIDARAKAAQDIINKLTDEEVVKKTIRLNAAKTLAIAKSEKIEAYDLQIDFKTARLQSAVRALRERERSMQTIRWSPIFNIKLPEDPSESEGFEFQFKPAQLENEIATIKHKIVETELDLNEKVSNTYVDVIDAENAITVLEERYRKLSYTVARLEIKVKDGTAALETGLTETDAEGNEVIVSPRILKARLKQSQERLTAAEDRLDNCQTELTNARTKYEESKRKLSDMIGFDVTTGYAFEDIFVSANLNRDMIEYLYNYALKDDATVYEAQTNYDEALLSLRVNYNLMKQKFPSDIAKIEKYVQQALDGTAIPKKAFKADYDQFLKDIDKPWQGSYKIWFISIPKEWSKGETDGIRYVEDDPYVLYSSCLEFESAAKELTNAKSDLHNTIYEEYSNYASVRKAYLNANKAYNKAEVEYQLGEVNYLLGEFSQEEFENLEDEYNQLKDDAEEARADFSETLYSFDRTTCGGLTKYLEGPSVNKTSEALSLVPVIRRGAIYTIRPIIDTQEFLLSVDVPDDFYAETGIRITSFELYCDGHQIGERTEVGQNLRHLMLSVKELGDCAIRVYDGTNFIDECRIEPSVFSGPLNITIGYEDEVNAHTIGTYSVSDDVVTDMLVLNLNLDQEQVANEYESGNAAAYYRLCVATDTYILSDRLIPVNQQFTYMSFMKGDLENLFIELFDENSEKIGDARFDIYNNELYRDIDEEDAAKLAELKKQQAIQQAIEDEKAAEDAELAEMRANAENILKALGLPTDNAAILFAMEHINELSYRVELNAATESLKIEDEYNKKKLEELKNDPSADPKEIKALEDRTRITSLMPDIYKKTVDENAQRVYDELEARKELYIKEQVAEYARNYNLQKSSEDENEIAECITKMGEIETELKTVYNSDAIDIFKRDVIPFDEAITRLFAYTGEDFSKSDRLAAYDADYKLCTEKAESLEANGYGTSFKSRLDSAVNVGFVKAKANLEKIAASQIPTIETITQEDFDRAVSLKTGMEKFNTLQEGSNYAEDAANGLRSAEGYYQRIKAVDDARLKKIDELNKELEVLYGQMLPLSTYESELQPAKNKYAKDQKLENSMKLTLDAAKSTYERAEEHYNKISGVEKSFYKGQYDKAKAAYEEAQAKYDAAALKLNASKMNLDRIQNTIDNYIAVVDEMVTKAEAKIGDIQNKYRGTASRTLDSFKQTADKLKAAKK